MPQPDTQPALLSVFSMHFHSSVALIDFLFIYLLIIFSGFKFFEVPSYFR